MRCTYMHNYDWTVNSISLDLHIFLYIYSCVFTMVIVLYIILLNKWMLRILCLLTGGWGTVMGYLFVQCVQLKHREWVIHLVLYFTT